MFSKELADKGLNLQAVFNINELPSDLYTRLSTISPDLDNFNQLILIAHGGTKLWQELAKTEKDSANPIDRYSEDQIKHYFLNNHPDSQFKFLYPGDEPVQLQALGELAGWHHKSPFMVGINNVWGSWFAYRAVLLTDAVLSNHNDLKDAEQAYQSPCDVCQVLPCLSACPPKAVSESGLDMDLCIRYRKSDNSKCKATCLARVACPVAEEHRYPDEQINYHYLHSLETIIKFY